MEQIPLFDYPTLNIAGDLKKIMSAAVNRSGLSREQILDKMNDLSGRYGVRLVSNGTLRMDSFEKFLNPNDPARQIPVRALPIFCAVVKDYAALDVLARPLGATVVGPKDQNLLKWAKAYFCARDARKAMRQLENDL